MVRTNSKSGTYVPIYRYIRTDWYVSEMNPRPKIEKCRCGEPVLVGWNRDRCALQVILDMYPLTAAGEVAALEQGACTFRLTQGRLQVRDQFNIQGSVPSHEVLVIRSHLCGSFIDPAHRLPKLPAKPTTKESAVLPF